MKANRGIPSAILCLSILLGGLLSACNGAYPVQLTMTDSLLAEGNFWMADSLMGAYHPTDADLRQNVRMYRHLLGLESRFVKGDLTSDDFSLADSLARYYKKRGGREWGLSQLVMGDLYKIGGDYPSALDCYLKTKQEAEERGDLVLQIWVNRALGNLYFTQRMLSECIEYYRNYYTISTQKHDTLRIAQSSFFMSRVCMINNDIDSIFFYLNQAIEFAKGLQQEEDITTPAKSALADIYIQTEKYEKAATLLTRHPRDDENWAYWHLGQHHTDSAIYYFKRLLERPNWRGRVEWLKELARLEEANGNLPTAFDWVKQLNDAKDSLKAHSQIEKTQEVKALHEYNQIKLERDEIEKQSQIKELALMLLSLLTLLVLGCVLFIWKKYRDKKEKELTQEKLLRQEEERKNRQSIEQIEKNEQLIALLNLQLQEAKGRNDEAMYEKLQRETQMLGAENSRIKAKQLHKQLMIAELQKSVLYKRIKQKAGKEHFHLTEEEWEQVEGLIDDAYDQFTTRLRILYGGITEYELRICYLLKIGIPSVAIGIMLYKSKAAIGMARQRLYKKLTGKDGTAKQFNEFIETF